VPVAQGGEVKVVERDGDDRVVGSSQAAPAVAERGAAKRHHVDDTQIAVTLTGLLDEREALADPPVVPACDVLAVVVDRARGRSAQGGEAAQQRGLPGAVGALSTSCAST